MSDDDHAQSPGAAMGVVEDGVADPINGYCLPIWEYHVTDVTGCLFDSK